MMICLWSRSTAATPDLWESICPHKHLTLTDSCDIQTCWQANKPGQHKNAHFQANCICVEVTHTPFYLVFNGFNDTSVFTLTQSLCSFEILKGRLHFLLFERHHGILQKGSQINNPVIYIRLLQNECWLNTGLKSKAKKSNPVLNPGIQKAEKVWGRSVCHNLFKLLKTTWSHLLFFIKWVLCNSFTMLCLHSNLINQDTLALNWLQLNTKNLYLCYWHTPG